MNPLPPKEHAERADATPNARFYDIDEFLKLGSSDYYKPRPGARAYFDAELLTIEVLNKAGRPIYQVDLEELTDAGAVLDTLLQLCGKTWSSADSLHDFVRALEAACRAVFGTCAQAVFCPFGQARRVDWRARRSDPRAEEAE